LAGLGHEVVERFELAKLLHWRKFEPEAISDQAAKTENGRFSRGNLNTAINFK
jgi:hypothetical protein